MKTLPTAFLIGWAAVAASTAWAEENETVKKDLAQLQGEWSMVSGSADGTAMPDAMRGTAKRVCKGDETTVTVGSQLIMKAKFTIDPSRKPKTIDYQMIDGPTKGKKQLGIYEVTGDTAKFCFGPPGAERPTDFTSKLENGWCGRPARPGRRPADRDCREHCCEKALLIASNYRSRSLRRVAGRHRRVACATNKPFFKHALNKKGSSCS